MRFAPSPFLAVLLSLCPAAISCAQTHRVAAPEAVTRAVGVYEWTGDLAKPNAARLIPVSLFIHSEFEDAGTYYARPVPLALLSGNVYSLEAAGLQEGTVTLDYARHLQTANSAGTDDSTDLGWFGYGTFTGLPAVKKPAPLRASRHVSEIVSSKDADRPTFAKRPADSNQEPVDRRDAATSATASPAPEAAEDPDRPHLSKPKTSATPAPASSEPSPDVSTKTGSTHPDADDNDRPTLRHRDPKQAEADRVARNSSRVEAMPGSLNNDPDRPSMKRGKTPDQAAAAQLTGLPAALHQSIAVSDAADREPHPFARAWSAPAERAEMLTRLQALAQHELASYMRANHAEAAASIPQGKPLPKSRRAASGSMHAVKPLMTPTAALTQESLVPLTLSYGGLPTFVYTAVSPSSAVPASDRYVTLVAQQLPTGELQVALSSVTDAAHLNRTPWLRFVDAVDADASHRASLLFELRAQHSRQFALYRLLSAKAEQIFLTHPSD